MSLGIQNEIFFFLVCTAAGVLLMFGYDLLRAVRRVFIHGELLVAAEDFLYCTAAGIIAFMVIFMRNSGVVRGFSLCAMLLGMVLYHMSASRLVLRGVSGVLRLFTTIFNKTVGFLFRPLAFFTKKIYKKTRKALKKRIKGVKMTLVKRRGSNS